MAQKKYTVEQMIVKLREAELLCSQGDTIAGAARQAGMTEQAFYRWRKEYGGMNSADAKRMKELEKENARLKRLVAEEVLAKQGKDSDNKVRPHSSLGGRPPAPQSILPTA